MNFEIIDAEPMPYAAAPQLKFKLGITNAVKDETVYNIALQCQIMIESVRRRYNAREQENLRDLFDEPSRWSDTLRTMLWTHTAMTVSSFTDQTVVELPVPCSFDFNLAATKYFAGLESGEVPLLFQFSGTCFYAGENGAMQIMQIPWTKESPYRLAVDVWQKMMELYYPNTAWLQLRRDVFDRLNRYKVRHAIPTFEQVLERLLSDDETLEASEIEESID